ncbi:MAG: hypothetical protein ABH829_05115 [archaeon]
MKKNVYQFGETELKDLIVAWVFLSLIFSYRAGFAASGDFLSRFLFILPTLGLGFIGHELSHKFAAQRYGFWAEFRISYSNLFFALILAMVSPIIFAAPGAVVIFPVNRHGRMADSGASGRISLAGPMANLLIVLLFSAAYLFLPLSPALVSLCQIGIMVNGFLAFFNLIPFSVLDGKKVFRWSKPVWALAFAISLLALYSV